MLKASACSANYLDLDHCVQVVGFDSTGPEPYWIVRNSWSTAWGESGFIRLQFDANTCGLADEAVVVDVDGAVPQVVPDTDDDALGRPNENARQTSQLPGAAACTRGSGGGPGDSD